jgi:HNH endonuclease
MCIYCGTDWYRKIYKEHYGPIPKDQNGRTYDIHHNDGNRQNNSPDNLIALSIQEHYDVHYAQGDYGACLRLTSRMALSQEEKVQLSKLEQQKRVNARTHNFLGGAIQHKRVKDGTHHLLGGEVTRRKNKIAVENGTHNLLGGQQQRESAAKLIASGLHCLLKENRKKVTCPHCGKTGDNNLMKRYHFNNCKTLIG